MLSLATLNALYGTCRPIASSLATAVFAPLCSMSYGSAPLGSVTSRYAGLPRCRSPLRSATFRTKAWLAGSTIRAGNRNGGDK